MSNPPEKSSGGSSDEPSETYIEEEVLRRVSQIVGKPQAKQVTNQVVALFAEHREEFFKGPIAHPRHLREYDEILPGAADRIITMSEGSLKHQQMMQERALTADIADTKEGRLYGLLALLALIACALISAVTGHEVVAGGFLGTGLLGTVGAFIKGRNGDTAPQTSRTPPKKR